MMSSVQGPNVQLQPRPAQERLIAFPRRGSHVAEAQPTTCYEQPSTAVLAVSRRAALPALALPLLLGTALAPVQPVWAEGDQEGAASSNAAPTSPEVVTYSSASQGYSFSHPASWEQVNKAGADVLFQDPERKSTSVGVTVYPVTISSLEEFGDLAAVGKRLLDAERAKESTLGVEMLSQQQRSNAGSGGPTVYDFVYKLDSTRGVKQVWSTVTVAARKLYILNGNLSCGKGPAVEAGPCSGSSGAAEALQLAARSFQVR